MATTTTNFNSSYFICLVAGSRSFDDYELLSQTLDNLLSNQPKVAIVSGGAKGADSLAERYAREHNLPLKVFPADWNRFGKSAGYKRNRQMHEFIAKFQNRGCVCFWGGKSKGIQHNFKLCDEFKNPLRIKRFNKEGSKEPSDLYEKHICQDLQHPTEPFTHYEFRNYANDRDMVKVTYFKGIDNLDCNGPLEYNKKERYMTIPQAREFYKKCLNAGFYNPWQKEASK